MEEATIYMNYRQAVEQADRLQAQADQLSRMADNRLADTMAQLQTHWKGENAQAYLGKCAALQEKVQRTARGLAEASRALRTAAERTYKAEMRALELAQKRAYRG